MKDHAASFIHCNAAPRSSPPAADLDKPVYSERYVTSLHERMREERERHEAERRELRDELAVAHARIADARRRLDGVARSLESVTLPGWCEAKDRPKEGA